MKTSRYSAYHSTILSTLKRQVSQYHKLYEESQGFTPEDIAPNADIEMVFLQKFGFALDESRLVIILLSHSFIEALANFYLALCTDKRQFNDLEKTGFIKKWTEIPCRFVPDYRLPTGEQIYQDLELLNTRRIAITHVKPEVIRDGLKILKGNLPKGTSNEHEFVMNCATLPLRLLKNLGRYDRTEAFRSLAIMSGYDISEFAEELGRS